MSDTHEQLVEDTLRRVLQIRRNDPDVRMAQANVRVYLNRLDGLIPNPFANKEETTDEQ